MLKFQSLFAAGWVKLPRQHCLLRRSQAAASAPVRTGTHRREWHDAVARPRKLAAASTPRIPSTSAGGALPHHQDYERREGNLSDSAQRHRARAATEAVD